MPNAGQFVFRPLLTQFTVKRGIGTAGPGTALAPLVSHSSVVGEYFVRDRQRIGHIDPRRAPGEATKRMQASKGTMQAFQMIDRAIIKTVPEELVEGMADQDVFQELLNASLEATAEIRFAHEKDVRDLLWATSQAGFNAIYGSPAVTVPTTKWNASGGKIREDVREKAEYVYKRCGFKANTVLMTNDVFDTIVSDPNNEIGERIKYTNGSIPTTTLLAQYFGVQSVIVADNLQDPLNPGLADVGFDYLYTGDSVLVAYIDPSNSRMKDTLASTFYRTNARKPFMGAFTRYNEDTESHEIKVIASYDVKMVDNFCGAVLWDVLT